MRTVNIVNENGRVQFCLQVLIKVDSLSVPGTRWLVYRACHATASIAATAGRK